MSAPTRRLTIAAGEWHRIAATLATPVADGDPPAELTLTRTDGRRHWAVRDRWRLVVIDAEDPDVAGPAAPDRRDGDPGDGVHTDGVDTDGEHTDLDLALDPTPFVALPPGDGVLEIDPVAGTATLVGTSARITRPLPDAAPITWWAALHESVDRARPGLTVDRDELLGALAASARTAGVEGPGYGELRLDGGVVTLRPLGPVPAGVSLDATGDPDLVAERTVDLDALWCLRAARSATVEIRPGRHPRLPTVVTAGEMTVVLWVHDPVSAARARLADVVHALDATEWSTTADGAVELRRGDGVTAIARVSVGPAPVVTVATVVASGVAAGPDLDAELAQLNAGPGPRMYHRAGDVEAAVDLHPGDLADRLDEVLDLLDGTRRRYAPVLSAWFPAADRTGADAPPGGRPGG